MIHHAHIVGTGSSMPERILYNKDLESIVDTSDEWIVRRSGIRERRISSTERDESTTDLSTRASTKALEMAGVSAEELDMIVVGTVTSDRQFPSTACMVQEALDARNGVAFDVSAGCGTSRTALVVGVDRLSSVINWQDRGTCVLLADGAGAVVVSSSPNEGGILSTHLKTDGRLWKLLYSSDGNTYTPDILQGLAKTPFHLKMSGSRLFKKAIECLSSISRDALKYNSLSSDEIDLVVPHQANIRIIQALANNLHIPMDKVYTNIHKYGNTSSATIPIALDEANREGRLNKGDHVLLITFGAGLTWGASILKWSI
ncbi:MAG: ketoacyl-ACP synthase III [Deltaproteobacteria bacterium]|nr:ketoacyl-ACP synthase III [Deltaproteobacteria bacterium]